MNALPIAGLLPDIRVRLESHMELVVQAPPGAGKTTQVPLALMNAAWLAGRKLVMLEPRRLAARAAARYMSRQLDEALGESVGYRVHMDTRVGPRTRVEVVTEGVLVRMLQADPALGAYGLVIFDEFHERSLQADLALALCLDMRAALRPDLRLLVMSATLDGARVARALHDARVLTSEGRSYPVRTVYHTLRSRERSEPQVASLLQQVLNEEQGSVLAFLPGAGEIRRVAARLQDRLPPDARLELLYGNLPQAAQDAAIRPAPAGHRKLVLATSIAETSLTIEGVRVVVDAGLARVPRFDPVSGLTRLVTLRVPRDSADQRRGRAGRLEPGVCYRLWSESERLEAHAPPEILQADLAPLALALAEWGEIDPCRYTWLDMPPAPAFEQAVELLQELDALDAARRITTHGRRLLALPVHPRLAHMLVEGAARNSGWLACLLAALVSERDVLLGDGRQGADAGLRLRALSGQAASGDADRGRVRGVLTAARHIAQALQVQESADIALDNSGALLALAYPDRVACRRSGAGARYLLSNGRGAYLAPDDALARSPWLAVAELDGDPREARIFLAAPIEERTVREVLAARIETRARISWDDTTDAVQAVRAQSLGAIVLEEHALLNPDPERVLTLLIAAIRRRGLACVPWTAALHNWQARVLLLRRLWGAPWPDVGNDALQATLEHWLAPWLAGCSRLAHLSRVPLAEALSGLLGYAERHALDTLAPERFVVPTGSRLALDYTAGEVPVLRVRIQELFGLGQTPAILDGRLPLLLELLSPAGRPLQTTRDLPGSWRGSYRDVRKDMRGRYPKHPWPEDPEHAVATRRSKRRAGAHEQGPRGA